MITPDEFKSEVYDWAEEIGVEPREIHLRGMTRKLASCSTRGRLTFDPSLLDAGAERRYEVVVHELLHLRYPNHGKLFKRLLNSYVQSRLKAVT